MRDGTLGPRPSDERPKCLLCGKRARWHCRNRACWWYTCPHCDMTVDPVPLIDF